MANIFYGFKVGVSIRALRNFFNLSQTDLANEAGISRPTISKLEKCIYTNQSVETLETLLNYFRSKGVKINIIDDEIELFFSEEALDKAIYPDLLLPIDD